MERFLQESVNGLCVTAKADYFDIKRDIIVCTSGKLPNLKAL